MRRHAADPPLRRSGSEKIRCAPRYHGHAEAPTRAPCRTRCGGRRPGGPPLVIEEGARARESSGDNAPAVPRITGADASRAERLSALGAVQSEVDVREQPFMLAALEERPFSRPGWLFEIKYDGVRVFASRRDEHVELRGRSGQVVTTRYPEIAAAVAALPASRFLIDGEIVAFDEEGRSSFERLQARMGLTAPRDIERAMAQVPVTGIFFDCLSLDGYDLRPLALSERKTCLRLVVPRQGTVRYGDHVEEQGEAFFDAASERLLEGIVAKKAASPYAVGRSRDWIKIKCQQRQEFVIGGYTDPQGARGYFGALHLGVYEDGRLVYVSKVGTGFDDAALRRLMELLRPLARATSPFDVGTPTGRGHHWVEPSLVCEVRFTEWTDDGGLRHPAFLGLRDDKNPEDCRREPLTAVSLAASTEPARPAEAPHVTISNPRKIFWPDEGYTKSDLVAYYEAVSPWLLPYLKERPLVLTRYPDGITGKSFYQKDAPEFVPSWVRTERVWAKEV